MKPIKFKQQNLTYAKNQPQYIRLPVYKNEDGMVVSRWKGNLWERIKFLFIGKIYISTLTFNKPLQPLKVEMTFKKII